MKALEFAYGSETYPSDWSEVTHQQRGVLRGNACHAASLPDTGQWARCGEGGAGRLKPRMAPRPSVEVSVEAMPPPVAIVIGLSFTFISMDPARMISVIYECWASLEAQLVKNPPAMWEIWVRSLGWEDSPGEGKGYPLQCYGSQNSMDCIVPGVAKSWT